MITLNDARGGPEFIGILVQVITDLSLLYAGTPDDNARQHLDGYLASIEPTIIETVGVGSAPKLLDALRTAVIGRKHEIENGGASRA